MTSGHCGKKFSQWTFTNKMFSLYNRKHYYALIWFQIRTWTSFLAGELASWSKWVLCLKKPKVTHRSRSFEFRYRCDPWGCSSQRFVPCLCGKKSCLAGLTSSSLYLSLPQRQHSKRSLWLQEWRDGKTLIRKLASLSFHLKITLRCMNVLIEVQIGT